MSSYAINADFEAFVEGWVTVDATALTRMIQRAERDIDYYVGPWTLETNFRKFGAPNASSGATNPKTLTAEQKVQLKNATCAQAYYRILNGEDWMMQDQHDSVGGPDFNVTGKRSRISPQAKAELANSGLVRRTAKATSSWSSRWQNEWD